MEGKGNFQIRPKRGKSIVEDGLLEIVFCWGIRAPRRHAHYLPRGLGAGGSTKGIRGHNLRRPQGTATRTV